MELNEIIKKIDALKAELDKLKPIKPEFQKKLDEKIRLEFSYNSNHIEGNTLTYGETELLLIRGKTRGKHDAREYEEMKGHDLAFSLIKDWAANAEHPLTETMIKELNRIILKEPFWKEAITSDGQPTRRLIKIGYYKEYPNSVRLQNGEIFEYASPTDTPIKMGELMQWYRKEEESKELHPPVLAALFHYRFVRIHPFDDGNGRVSRLLMNYVLLKNNLPPVIIKSADKKNYLAALNNADTGDLDSFVGYVANELVWSLELCIEAAKGESIEEADDWEKELDLVKKELKSREDVNVRKSREVIKKLYTNSLSKLFIAVENKLNKFNDLFNETNRVYSIEEPVITDLMKRRGNTLKFIEDQIFFDVSEFEKYGKIKDLVYEDGKIFEPEGFNTYPEIFKIDIFYNWRGFKKAGINPFHFQIGVNIVFEDLTYTVSGSRSNINIKKTYSQDLNEDECEKLALDLARITLQFIKTHSGVQQ